MKLIFGCGYLGERVARRWRDQGEKVCCVTRSRQRANSFQREGFATLVADVTERESVANLPVAETVLFAVGFDRSRRETATIEDVYAGGMRNV